MELKVEGTIKQIFEIEKGVSGAGKDWEKVSFLLDTGAEYNPEICFQIFGQEKSATFLNYNKVGDKVDVSFNISSREYNGKYYHNIDAWKVYKAEGVPQAQANTAEDETDTLPWE